MITPTKPLSEISQDAVSILYREIGIVNTVRFLTQFTSGYGNYTIERRVFFDDLTLDDLVEQIKQARMQTIENV
jgi:hypothetical protein